MREGAKNRALARLAPVAFVAGVTLLALSLLLLSLAATDTGSTTFAEPELTTLNGTATLAYVVPSGIGDDTILEGSFRFPEAPGKLFVVGCGGYEALRDGRLPAGGASVRVEGMQGSFRSADTLFGPLGGALCPVTYVVLQWPVEGRDAESNRPEVDLALKSSLLVGVTGLLVVGFGLVGTLLALVGGLAWGGRLNRERPVAPAPDDESAAETLLVALEKSGAWLERTRRYLLLAGVLGLFLWYPILLPWAWNLGVSATGESRLPWLVPAGVLAILLTLTAVWAREFLRLDRELVQWRDRMARLRAREAALLDAPAASESG